MSTKIITLLITGTVLTAGLMMGFGGYVFAGDPATGLDITICQNPPGPCSRVSDKIYDSSFSKTKSIGLVRKEVGDVLLRYGVGGADINKVTEALEGSGVYEAELKWFLLAIGINEKDAQDILVEFDTIGISKDNAQGVSTPDAGGAVPSASVVPGIDISLDEIPSKQAEPVPACPKHTCTEKEVCVKGICVPSSAAGTIKDILPSKRAPSAGDTPQARIFIKLGDLPGKRAAFEDSSIKSIQDLKAAESKEQRENIRKELQANRETLQKSTETLRQDLRANAQDLRENFKLELKNVRLVGYVAVAHGKGLRMINRYRSAIARFDHILGRLESRIEKIGIEIESETRAQGNVLKVNNPGKEMAIAFIEEAKNTQALNKAKLAELEAKYESLLLGGENPGGIAKEARAIAKELKSEIEKLHGLLNDIQQASVDYNSSRSNVKL